MVSLPSVSEISFNVLRSLPPRNRTQEQFPIIVSALSLYDKLTEYRTNYIKFVRYNGVFQKAVKKVDR